MRLPQTENKMRPQHQIILVRYSQQKIKNLLYLVKHLVMLEINLLIFKKHGCQAEDIVLINLK